MKFKIIFYAEQNKTEPVKEFIRSLPIKMKAKTIREIDLLEELGTLEHPHTRSIQGDKYKGLWELRIKQGSDIARVLYFTYVDQKIVLLHGFIKKTDKTPENELLVALNRMKNHKSNNN